MPCPNCQKEGLAKGTRPSRWTIYEVGPDACMKTSDMVLF